MSLRPETRPSGFELRAFVVVVVAVSSVAATWIVATASRTPPAEPERATIEVNAAATHRVSPDLATWTLTAHGKDAVATAKKLLAAHGIADADVVVKPGTSMVDEDSTDTQDLDITTTDVARLVRAYRAATADGLTDVEVGEPDCTLADSEPGEQAALVEAQQRVHARAEAAARAYGAKLGRVTAASVGDVDTDNASACDDIVMTATANATYELE